MFPTAHGVVSQARKAAPPPDPGGAIEFIGYTLSSVPVGHRFPPVAVPDGAQENDCLVAVITVNSRFNGFSNMQGFTEAFTMIYTANANRETHVFYRMLPATPPSQYVLTGNSNTDYQVAALLFRGVDDATPVQAADWDEANATTHPLPDVTAVDGAAAVGVWRTRAGNTQAPNGSPEMTFLPGIVNERNMLRYVGYETGLTAGTYTRSRWLNSGTEDYNRGVLLLRPK